MRIFAHRGLISGKDKGRENTLPALEQALRSGYDIETDIRRSSRGDFYISHDPIAGEPCGEHLASHHFELWRSHPDRLVALDLKEPGYEPELIARLNDYGVGGRLFLFDMELYESKLGETAKILSSLSPALRLASRASDRNEPIDRALADPATSILWIDEFELSWLTFEMVEAARECGKLTFVVSPDLHGAPLQDAIGRWSQLIRMRVDGICTDYPAKLQEMLSGGDHEQSY